ncbi:MAG: hypothetical protein N2Z59_01270 [Alteraurantiacibacter sp.]|nr:hypothetical protein [Alteraurantiacibacter sp.]
MIPQTRLRRIGWFALLAVCTALYAVLHFHVWSVSSEVKKAERRIVQLERINLLLETEFLTRSSQVQLAAWNRVDFGYSAPEADQFIVSERQLARFSSIKAGQGPEPIRLASYAADEEVEPFPRLVSPVTGKPVGTALAASEKSDEAGARILLAAHRDTGRDNGPLRLPLAQRSAVGSAVRVALAGNGP